MKRFNHVASIVFLLLAMLSCTGEPENVAVMEVDFDWQAIDKGSQDNPEIRLSGIPEGTTRFLVSLVDLDVKGFDHGSGYIDNDGTGLIARGAVKGTYNGPDPPFPNMKHDMEITVEAFDADGTVIGIGRRTKTFEYADAE